MNKINQKVNTTNHQLSSCRHVWGSNAPRRKYVSWAGSTSTKRNLLQVTPATLLQHVGGTRSTFTSCGAHPPYTFTSCGLHPPYCFFVLAAPATLSCPATANTSSKLSPVAGCGTNLYTAVYDFIVLIKAGAHDVRVCEKYTEFNSDTCIRCIIRITSFRITTQECGSHACITSFE
jgi:hypothetical protein